MNCVIGFKKLSVHAFLQSRGSPKSAGLELRSPYKITIPKHGKNIVLTDLAVQLPQNCYGRIASRSGLALNKFIEVAGGVIGVDYTGNIGVILYNHSDRWFINKVELSKWIEDYPRPSPANKNLEKQHRFFSTRPTKKVSKHQAKKATLSSDEVNQIAFDLLHPLDEVDDEVVE